MKATVAQLAQLPGVWRGGELERAVHATVATGHARLDAELPGGGWPMGTLTEVLHDGVGIGEVSFLAAALARACEAERIVAWIHAPHLPYAPSLARAGLDPARCLVVRPTDADDALWSAEQCLRSGACGAVLLWPDPRVQYASLRRLQMAAEAGRSMAVMYRSTAAERLSTPAHLRVVIGREQGLLELRIPKRRGPPLASPIVLAVGRTAVPSVPAPSKKPSPARHSARARALHLVRH